MNSFRAVLPARMMSSALQPLALENNTAPQQQITSVAVDVEFLKCADRVTCRSAAFVPFRASGGDTAGFDEFSDAFAVHLPAEVTLYHADVLPAGWALKHALQSPEARRLFGSQSPSPYIIPNPLKHRDAFRRITFATASTTSQPDDSLDHLNALLLSMCHKLDEKAGVTALIEALSDPFRCCQTIDFIEDLARHSTRVLRHQLAKASEMDDDSVDQRHRESDHFVREWVAPTQDAWADAVWGNLLTLGARKAQTAAAASTDASRSKKGQRQARPPRRGRPDQLRLVSYGSSDEAALNAALMIGARKAWTPLTVLNIENHRSFSSSMMWLGLRPRPKLVEAIAAVSRAVDSIKDGPRAGVAREAAAFLKVSGGVESNHNPVWDAKALAIVARWVEAFSMVRVEDL